MSTQLMAAFNGQVKLVTLVCDLARCTWSARPWKFRRVPRSTNRQRADRNFPQQWESDEWEALAADGYPAGGWDSSGIIPEPRLGFAYQLTDDHKTVLRAGRGLFLLPL